MMFATTTLGTGDTCTTAQAWGAWNNGGTCTSTAVTMNGVDPWYQWTAYSDGTASTSTTATWRYWVNGSELTASDVTSAVVYSPAWENWVEAVELSHEQKAEQAAAIARRTEEYARQEAAAQARWIEQQRKRDAAEKVAEQTLKSLLTPEQQAAWENNKAIFVTSQSGKKYRIKHGLAGNITEYDDVGRQVANLCVHIASMGLPIADNVIAQLLAIRHNEAMLLKLANRSVIRA